MNEKVRINKYLASCGIASRRQADELIKAGKVQINGKVITEPGCSVSKKDKVRVDGKEIHQEKFEYYVFYKPAGFLTSKSDPQKRKTIYDILPENFRKLNPAGRLDRATSGLLIMTNDGDLINNLIHPKIQVSKVYKVTVEGKLTDDDFKKFKNGMEIEKGKIAYADAEFVDCYKGETTLKMTLTQGYNRQIRKMMDMINHPVVHLKRISHATLTLTGLERGQYRKIEKNELRNLIIYLNKKLHKLDKEAE